MYKYLKYKHKYLQLREERGGGGGRGDILPRSYPNIKRRNL